MATTPTRRKVTAGELIDLLHTVPEDTAVLLITDSHGCAGWLDTFTYDADARTVDLSASMEAW